MENKLKTLLKALKLLAADAEIQINAYPPFVAFGDELVDDFDAAYNDYKDHLNKEQTNKLNKLNKFIDSKSGTHNKEFWLEKEPLYDHPDWQKIRELATECLAALENK